MLTTIRRTRSRLAALLAMLAAPLFLPALFEGEGGGAGTGEGGAGTGGAGAGGGGAGDGGGTGGSGDGGSGTGEGGADKTFSQADVDRIVQERLARAKTKPPDDYDELKTRAAKWTELEEKSKTELQREKDRADAAERKGTETATKAQGMLRRAAIISEAAKAGADTDLVVAYLQEHGSEDQYKVTVGDDGQVTGAADAVKAAIKAKPNLVGKSTSAGSADGGTRTGAAEKPKTLEDAVTRAYATSG